jgi:uncharacterized membrane protein
MDEEEPQALEGTGLALERWAAAIASASGGIALLAAVVFAARWALREGWLGGHPEVGLAFGLVLGSGALCAAELCWSQKQRVLASGLGGSGLGILYFVLYAAHAWYDLLGATITTVALLAATAVGAITAVRRDSELMAVLGFVGGMGTPLLMGPHAGPYLAYLVVLNAAVAAASLWRGWRVLPWLGIAGTLLMGVSWAATSYGAEGALLANVSAATLGVGYALLAAHPRVPRDQAIPWLVGAAGGLAAALPFLGLGEGVVITAVIPLLSVSVLTSLLRLAATRHEGDARFVLLILVQALGCIALFALAVRWQLAGEVQMGTVLALVVVPALSSRLIGWAADGEQLSSLVMWGASLVGAVMLSVSADLSHGWIVALAIAATGWLAELGLERRGGLGALATAAAALSLVTAQPPELALLAGLLVFVLATLPALLTRPSTVTGYLPALASPLLLVPLLLSWRTLTGEDWMGAIPLALGAVCAVALLLARLPLGNSSEEARRLAVSVWWALTLLFSTLALPMQLEAQWLTVAWAMEGAALLTVASRSRSSWLSAVALGLLAAVTVRLVANPAVLDYHLVKRPHAASWVWYGYGLPVLALVHAAITAWVPEAWGVQRVRLALQVAAILVAFAGVNLLVSHGFAGGETLTLLDTRDAARAARTVAWTTLGVTLLGVGGSGWVGARVRWGIGLGLLGAGALKLALWDLWVLDTLPSALELAGVALCAFGAAGLLTRAARRVSRAPVIS